MTSIFPARAPDPRQRGVVTRYGTMTAFDAAAVVSQMMADPAVVAWATSKSLSGADLTAFGTLLQAALFSGYGGAPPQTGYHQGAMAATGGADVLALGTSAALRAALAALDEPDDPALGGTAA